jgi:hypothetical protein
VTVADFGIGAYKRNVIRRGIPIMVAWVALFIWLPALGHLGWIARVVLGSIPVVSCVTIAVLGYRLVREDSRRES